MTARADTTLGAVDHDVWLSLTDMSPVLEHRAHSRPP